MIDRLQQFWRDLRVVVLGDQSTLSEPSHPTEIRHRVLIFSLLASILIWFILSLSENYYLPIEYATCTAADVEDFSGTCIEGLAEDSALTQRLPETIQATLYGSGISLIIQRFQARYWSNPITFNSDQATVDAQLLLRVPEQITIESIFPERIEFIKEERVDRRIPVESRVDFVSQPPHFFIGQPQLNPDSVVISGPASMVRQIQSWPTEPFTLLGVHDTVQVQVDLSDSLRGMVRLDSETTTVTGMAPQYTEGQKEGVRVEIVGIPNANSIVQLEPATVTINYQVPVSKYSKAYGSELIQVFVSYNQIYSDTTGHVQPTVEFPAEFMLRQIRVSPDQLRYYVNIGSL